MANIRMFRLALLLWGVAIITGCGGATKGPATVTAKGKVTQNSAPVEGANVIFYPDDANSNVLASQAVTNAQGEFELSTSIGAGEMKPGIVPGKYKVAISKLEITANMMAPPKELLPKKFADPKTSGFSVDVVDGKANEFTFPADDK